MDAVELAPGHGQVARLFGAAGEQDGVEVCAQLLGRHRFFGAVENFGALAQPVLGRAHEHAGAHLHALGLHLLHTPIVCAIFYET